MGRKPTKQNEGYVCRHVECSIAFKNTNSRWRHEGKKHPPCEGMCATCEASAARSQPTCKYCRSTFSDSSTARRHERLRCRLRPDANKPRHQGNGTDEVIDALLTLAGLTERTTQQEEEEVETPDTICRDQGSASQETFHQGSLYNDEGDGVSDNDVEENEDSEDDDAGGFFSQTEDGSVCKQKRPTAWTNGPRKPFPELCRSEKWRIEKEFLDCMRDTFRVHSREDLPPILKRLCSSIENKEENSGSKLLQVARYCHEHNVTRESWPKLEAILKSGFCWNKIWTTLQRITDVLTPIEINDGEGHRYALEPFLALLFEQLGFDPKKVKKRLKLAIDGASKTNKSRFVSVTIEPLDSPSSLLYSEDNAHLLGFFWGQETEKNLRAGLIGLVDELLELSRKGNRITIPASDIEKEKEVQVEFFLSCDMVCLAKILGFNAVWNPNSTYSCLWCEATKEQLSDFGIPEWKLRDIADVVNVGRKQATKKKPAPEKGIVVREDKKR
jgi:hypothetical protein